MARRLTTVIRTSALALPVSVAAWLGANPAEACTTFYMDHDGPMMGKTYNWATTPATVYITKRGWVRESLAVTIYGDVPSEWTTQYASITFNDYAYRVPIGGVNEAGLAIETLQLVETAYPAADARPSYNEVEWVQFGLDNFASVAELAAMADTYRVAPVLGSGFHYFACDATGECAAFEYLNGQLVITPSANMPAKTLTNDTYSASAAYLAQHEGFGGTDPIPTGTASLDRFVRASWMAQQPPSLPVPDSMLAIIDDAASGMVSPWRIAYRLADGAAYWRTEVMPSLKYVNLSAFDLNCYSGDLMLDIDDPGTGDVSASFVPIDAAINLQKFEASFAEFRPYYSDAEYQALLGLVDRAHSQQECTIEPGAEPDGDDDDDEEEDEGGCSVSAGADSAPAWPLLGLMGVGVGLARRARRRS